MNPLRKIRSMKVGQTVWSTIDMCEFEIVRAPHETEEAVKVALKSDPSAVSFLSIDALIWNPVYKRWIY